MKNQIKIFSIIVLTGFVVSGAILFSCKSQQNGKTRSLEYGASIRAEKKNYSVRAGNRLHLDLKLKNTRQKTLSSSTENPCLLSYHLLDESGQIIQYDNRRFPIPQDILPGQKVDVPITVKSPLEKGRYILEFDLLREGLSWFKDYGSKTLKIALTVLDQKWIEEENEWTLNYGIFTTFTSNVKELNTLYRLIRLTLAQSEVEFNGQTGKIFGFSAGTDYSQIWVRDANTILFASKFFYGQPYLTSWIEEHLAYQKDNGALEDWINATGKSEKNTTETDQEASIVQPADDVFLPYFFLKPFRSNELKDLKGGLDDAGLLISFCCVFFGFSYGIYPILNGPIFFLIGKMFFNPGCEISLAIKIFGCKKNCVGISYPDRWVFCPWKESGNFPGLSVKFDFALGECQTDEPVKSIEFLDIRSEFSECPVVE